MVAVALLAVIILGLVAMFDQTRKAFTLGLNTSDYEGSGRVVMDLLTRDLQQMAPMNGTVMFTNTQNPANVYTNAVNFYVDGGPNVPLNRDIAWPLVQNGDVMITTLQRLFFVTRYNQQWTAIGYKVDPIAVGQGLGVGTLYRYSAGSITNVTPSNPGPLLDDFFDNLAFAGAGYPANVAPFNRIIDGVVNFRVRAFTAKGANTFPPGILITGPIYFDGLTNIFAAQANVSPSPVAGEYRYAFYGNADPGYVEVELSVLEPRTLEQFRALTNTPALAAQFLTNHAGQVHVFRQRIPVRSLEPGIYP